VAHVQNNKKKIQVYLKVKIKRQVKIKINKFKKVQKYKKKTKHNRTAYKKYISELRVIYEN
jgi:hypothetical protein